MQVILHTGAHGTDNDRLLKCLLRNAQMLSDRGTVVPGPGKYRDLLAQALRDPDTHAGASADTDALMDAILDGATARRMILSDAFFFGSQRFAVQDGAIYPNAVERLDRVQQLFRGSTVELRIGLRNPAGFLADVLRQTGSNRRKAVLDGKAPATVRWSELLARIRRALPDLPVTAWCNEDTPVLWGHIIRDMAGLPDGEKITGAFDLMSDLMRPDGMRRFRAYLHKNPDLPEPQKRQVMMAFLDRYAIADRIEEELDAPGWTDALVAELTETYEADVDLIRQMPGLRFLTP